ncbi:MAG TPA: cell division protein FtsQ/DivIB [Ideonella sp.]|nr:cell division protein FtsQ/DivIB [Ideonella sp.]
MPDAAVPLPADIRWTNALATLLFAGVAALGLAALGAFLARQPLFAIRSIEVAGDVARNSVSTIRANALPQLAGNFFSLDLGAARRAFESVPWVRRAVVRRVWPDRLEVRLEEHRPAALWEPEDEGGGDRLVNTEGEVFEANLGDVEDDALPAFSGPEGTSATLLAAYRRLAPVFARLNARVERLTLSGRGSWRAELDSGAAIEIGRGSEDELDARSERFVRTVSQVTTRYGRPLKYADLRHADGYALRLEGVSTTVAAAPKSGERPHN